MSDLQKPHYLKTLTGVATKAVDTVLPPRCVVSGAIVDRQGAISPKVWSQLRFISNPFCGSCGYPFDFEVADKTKCATCLETPPLFDTARAALVYDDISRDMILKFKHGDKTHAVYSFMPWLKRAGADMLGQGDMLIPVPLHRWRLLKRRYNQAAIIAMVLGKQTGVSFESDLLLRKRATVTQGHLSVKDRARNVKNAFAVNPEKAERLYDKHVILIDDVYTSGATINECCKVLRKASVGRIDVLTVARVVRPD